MVRLTASDIRANAREIGAIARRPAGRIGARTDCVVCSETIAPDEKAYLLTKGVAAHPKCVHALRERLDAAMP
jgi:hypothetical protein